VSIKAAAAGIILAVAVCCANWQTAAERVWLPRLTWPNPKV